MKIMNVFFIKIYGNASMVRIDLIMIKMISIINMSYKILNYELSILNYEVKNIKTFI